MEAVHASQEEMASELKELLKLSVFSQAEVKQIIVKRTAFESALIRLKPRKADYLRYIEYLMALEALRKKRVTRLNLPSSGNSITDYCFVRAQFYIFERALKPFKDDVGLWVQFIEAAKREKATSLAGRIATRALQMHPTSVSLYILAAAHQMRMQSPSAARTILQRGLRLNPESVQLWTEYVKMELEYIEARREELQKIEQLRKEQLATGLDGLTQDEIVPELKDEEGMQRIMEGAIVTEVIRSAAKGLPRVALFESLHRLLSTYPTPLRQTLLDLLHSSLRETLPNDAEAIRLSATWSIGSFSEDDADLVEKLQSATKQFAAAVKSGTTDAESIGSVYSEWVSGLTKTLRNDFLKAYLIRSFHSAISSLPPSRLSPALLSADLHLARDAGSGQPTDSKLLARAKRYMTLYPTSADLWFKYLDLIKGADLPLEEKEKAWKVARSKATGSVESLCQIWLWGVDLYPKRKGKERAYEDILQSSIQHRSNDLHPHLLLDFIQRLYTLPLSSSQRLDTVTSLVKRCLPSDACYRYAFNKEVHCESTSKDILLLLHSRWRQLPGCDIEAALCYAEWLIRRGGDTSGKEAKDVIDRTRTTLDEGGREVLDGHWTRILDGTAEADSEDSDGMEDDQNSSHIDNAVSQKQRPKLPTPPMTPELGGMMSVPAKAPDQHPLDLDFIAF